MLFPWGLLLHLDRIETQALHIGAKPLIVPQHIFWFCNSNETFKSLNGERWGRKSDFGNTKGFGIPIYKTSIANSEV